MKLRIGSVFYRIGADYISKEKVYMCNKEAFISENTFNDCLIEESREQLYFDEENRTWTRTLKKAKEISGFKKFEKVGDDYWGAVE